MDRDDFPRDDFEFGEAHSGAAGRLGAYRHAVSFLQALAGERYVAGKDAAASEFRDAAKALDVFREKLEDELDAYIKESFRRGMAGQSAQKPTKTLDKRSGETPPKPAGFSRPAPVVPPKGNSTKKG